MRGLYLHRVNSRIKGSEAKNRGASLERERIHETWLVGRSMGTKVEKLVPQDLTLPVGPLNKAKEQFSP